MGGLTDYGSQAWAQALLGVTDLPTGYYVALLAQPAGPGMDGTLLAVLEPSGGGYARQPYGTGPDNWTVDGDGVASAVDLAFPVPTADWGIVTDFALCDAASAGEVFAWGALSTPLFVATGWQLVIPAGALSISLTSLDPTLALS